MGDYSPDLIHYRCMVHTLPQESGPGKLFVLKSHSRSQQHKPGPAGAHGKALHATDCVGNSSSTHMGKR